MLEVTEGRQSINGCPATATMFTTTRGTGALVAQAGMPAAAPWASLCLLALPARGAQASPARQWVVPPADCELVTDLYSRGYEISTHTITHPSVGPATP